MLTQPEAVCDWCGHLAIEHRKYKTSLGRGACGLLHCACPLYKEVERDAP